MKPVNLVSLLHVFFHLEETLKKTYFDYHEVKIKDEELNDLSILIELIKKHDENYQDFDGFNIGFVIPQIGKEFDLIKINSQTVLNIELKQAGSQESIKKQLILNRHYLEYLKKELYQFTFVSSDRTFYSLSPDLELVKVNIEDLISILHQTTTDQIIDISSQFKPSEFLVSPFNSTFDFLNDKYFLTPQQDEIKDSILKVIPNTTYSIFGVSGNAGTGKSLLIYDIAKDLQLAYKTLIIHCGYLNNGHDLLNQNDNWDIIPAKSIDATCLKDYKVIIIDEAQRIKKSQFQKILKTAQEFDLVCVFGYDPLQTLTDYERNRDIAAKIEEHATSKPFVLSKKIRTNKEVASFIKRLFNLVVSCEKMHFKNVDVIYFKEVNDAKRYLEAKSIENWQVINYTSSIYYPLPYDNYKVENVFENAHTVFGQEYDNVIAVLDDYFYYDEDKCLSTLHYEKYAPYNPTQMLYQIVSRAKSRLRIVVINNPIIIEQCFRILNN